jgi:hypothetical protein
MKKKVRKMLFKYAVKMAFSANDFKHLKRRWDSLPWDERERVRKQFEAAKRRSPKEVYESEGSKKNGNQTSERPGSGHTA